MPPPAWVEEVEGFTRGAQARALDPLAWAIHVSSVAGADLPSPELAELLVDHACWKGDAPCAWKYLERALSSKLVSPVVAVALLSTRVIPNRHVRPASYRLYMEILKQHSILYFMETSQASYDRDFKLADNVLGLSRTFRVQPCNTGVILVEFVLCIIWQLVDAALEDEGLMNLTVEKRSRWLDRPNYMDADGEDSFEEHRVNKLHKFNTVMSIELIAQFLQDKTVSRLLFLANENMHSDWRSFSLCLGLLAAKSSAFQNLTISPDSLISFSLDLSSKNHKKYLPIRYRNFSAISSGSLSSTAGGISGPNHSSLWIPLDLFLEDSIKGSIAATSSIEVLYDLVKALQAVYRISWNDTFLSLWLAALRLVQRESYLTEVPEPHVDIRMCMLLSIVTLTIAELIEDEDISLDRPGSADFTDPNEKLIPERSKALVSCLQMLGEFGALLIPPVSVISSANQAARKAMMVTSGIPVTTGSLDGFSLDDKARNCSGNLRHLIVEACIARNLLDTSAYYWPGYVNGQISKIPQSIPSQVSCWAALMKGVPLKSLIPNGLLNTPPSSLAEIEKIFEIAVTGSVDEKISAATILCGPLLVRCWNFQEHTVCLVVKLLSPPVPVNHSGSESHLINHAPILNVVLNRISENDCVQVFSLHGLVPELAGSLMPICEAFGSCMPDISWTLPTGESISVHMVFSNAFVLLLSLWRFNYSPLEYCFLGERAPLGSKLNPDYLLFLRNLDVLSFSSSVPKKRKMGSRISTDDNSKDSIFLDSFPRLKAWYMQHQACLASTLSGLISGTPVHQTVDCLLNGFKKAETGSGNSAGSMSGSGSLSSSSAPPMEESSPRSRLPAWDILEAVPFVVDAALTACSCGRMSPRELVTGLKDLADFLPASLGAIVSYFTAEATRGVWKPAFMNGTDWPSPAANLSIVEEHIRRIVATTGVNVPSLVTGNSPSTLPLPLAAFLSFTITYNLDKSSELNLVGPALENLATSCPWPSMPIVSALWTQKVKRWSYYLTFASSGTIFYHDNDAVVQLLRSCFSAFLGLPGMSTFPTGGVGSLLGHGSGTNISSTLSPVAPGVLYLEIHQKIRDIVKLSKDILSTMMLSVREFACDSLPKETREKMKKSKYGFRYGHASLFSALAKAKSAASMGAILIWLSGDSGIVQVLIREILPSWFLSIHDSGRGEEGMLSMLEGYTLAYFVVLCGLLAWGIDSTRRSRRRPRILGCHLKFLADALDGQIVLCHDRALWQAYITHFLDLLVDCAPNWIVEVESGLLKRLGSGLKKLGERELAIRLLERGGSSVMGAAAEMIVSGK